MNSNRSKYQIDQDMLKQIRSSIQMLEFWKARTTPLRGALIEVVIDILGIVSKDIYENELHAVGDMRD
jgi:hypothetical protein